MIKQLGSRFLMLVLILGLGGCGIEAGTGTAPNDPRPTGAVLKQGAFVPQGGKSSAEVSGTAIIFTSGTGYVLRLDGITMPEESGLQVRVQFTIGTNQTFSLRASSGNQNYSFAAIGAVFKSVEVYSPTSMTNYAVATLL